MRQGAEAVIHEAGGRLRKERLQKSYRHPQLDDQLRAARTRDEASLIMAARRAGVPVPVVYDIDRQGKAIHMERIDGITLREQLEADDDSSARQRMATLGRIIAQLHVAEIAHGDLTTSNVMVPTPGDHDGLVLIDFGLGQFTQEDEPRAVDLHLVEEALESTDGRHEALFAAFLDAYQWPGRSEILRRLEDIRERGRYR